MKQVNTPSTRTNPALGRVVPILLFAVLLITAVFFLMQVQPAAAAVNCADSSWQVGDEADLNAAIACFNAKPAGDYTITLTQTINLTASSTTINNATDGTTLLVEGSGFTVDGQDMAGVRPFNIAISNTVTIQNITITGGNTAGSNGGGVHNEGTLTLSNSTISNNSTDNVGGGIYTFNGTLTVINSTISGNSATSRSGGIENGGSGTLTITNSTISGNSADSTGGGIYNFNSLTVTNSTISGNSANVRGGGIENSSNGTFTVTNSTINNNLAGVGGGIYNFGSLTGRNSTISSNSATTRGGGIENSSHGTLTVTNSTINNNLAGVGGGIYNFGTLTVDNSIIANSPDGGDCAGSGSVTDNGHNLIEDAANACGLTDGTNNNIIGQDPLLGSLQDNGGSTFTHALLAGSPALDAGDTTLTTDQRGVTRPQEVADDIGAFEQYDCSAQPWLAGSEGELDAAIDCFNAQTAANSYTISLTQNVSLITSTTTITNSTPTIDLTIEGNDNTVDGQGIVGVRPFEIATNTTATIQNITITGGISDLTGGGIHNEGNLTVTNSTLSNNYVRVYGGGIYNSGTLTVTNSTFSDNVAAVNSGGGINNSGTATVNNTVFSSNSSALGGGIANISFFSTLTVTNSTISGNSATSDGGGIFNDATLTITNSTISGNSTDTRGGGITNQSTLAVSNSTISGNSATIDGGGIRNIGTLAVSNSTFSDNSADSRGGGIINNSGTLTIDNSIIANSPSGGDCMNIGTLNDNGYNLIEDTEENACGLTDGTNNNIIGQDPVLGPLQDNGGPATSSGQATFTHALLGGSPAI